MKRINAAKLAKVAEKVAEERYEAEWTLVDNIDDIAEGVWDVLNQDGTEAKLDQDYENEYMDQVCAAAERAIMAIEG